MLGDSVRRRQPQRKPRRAAGGGAARARGGGGWKRWKSLLIGLPLALVVPPALGYLLAVFVFFPPTEVSGAGIPVPDLIGRNATEAQREIAAVGLGAIQLTEMPHPSAPQGQVVAQSPLAGQQLRPGADVRIAISSGRPRVIVPDVTGFSAERAESLLRRTGFEVRRASQESGAVAGRVIRTDPEPGQLRALPAEITIIISTGPPPEPEPVPPGVDTLLTRPPPAGPPPPR